MRLQGHRSRLCEGVFLALALLIVAAGCGREQGDSGQGVLLVPREEQRAADAPAPGTMKALPPEPLELEAVKTTWLPLWTGSTKENWDICTVSGLKAEEHDKPEVVTVQTQYDTLVIPFGEDPVDASRIAAVRANLDHVDGAGLWWAREQDVAGDRYPFDLTRFAPFVATEAGQWEADLSDAENWEGEIRMLRVDPYAKPGDAIGVKVVQTLMKGWASPIKPAKLDLTHGRSPTDLLNQFVGRATATRLPSDVALAVAHFLAKRNEIDAGAEKPLKALVDTLGKELIAEEKMDEAIQVYSAAATLDGDPVGYLAQLVTQLPPGESAALWSEAPYLIVESFEQPTGKPFFAWTNKADRSIDANEFSADAALDGLQSAHLVVGEAKQEGEECWLLAKIQMPVPNLPFSLRFYVRGDATDNIRGVVLAQLPSSKKYVYLSTSIEPVPGPDGWQCLDLGSDVYEGITARAEGESIDGAVIDVAGLRIEGDGGEFWMDRVEAYLLVGN